MEGTKITDEVLESIDKILLAYGMLDKKNSLLDMLSSGELERVSTISSVVLNKPIQLYDEPLSKLDVCTAHRMLEDLKNSAKKNNTCVILSVHQPNPEILSYFDRLMVLCKYGVLYQGRTEDFSKYFKEKLNLSITTAEDLIELCYIIENDVSLRDSVVNICKKNYNIEENSQVDNDYEEIHTIDKKPLFKFNISFYLFLNFWRIFKSGFTIFKMFSLTLQISTVLGAVFLHSMNYYFKNENDLMYMYCLFAWLNYYCIYQAVYYFYASSVIYNENMIKFERQGFINFLNMFRGLFRLHDFLTYFLTIIGKLKGLLLLCLVSFSSFTILFMFDSYSLNLINGGNNIVSTLIYYVKRAKINIFEMVFYFAISVSPFTIFFSLFFNIIYIGLFFKESKVNILFAILLAFVNLGNLILKSDLFGQMVELLFNISAPKLVFFKFIYGFIVAIFDIILFSSCLQVTNGSTFRFKDSDLNIFLRCLFNNQFAKYLLPFVVKGYKGMLKTLIPYIVECLVAFLIIPFLFYLKI
ncbi:AB14G [Hepatospora eriocheir]|uniref:AB14G n=1 Tax=Hepatospora eriocheir TaxID=1081669 RepID=A0A1X0QHP5_9MICR|nr:AB14G [Hepatospora eriocheir]